VQIIENKALLVETRAPEAITGVLKKAAVVGSRQGKSKVAVHWGLKEAQVLTALGHDEVPSPILRDYKWTGKFAPFAHQKTTASFLTLRKRAFCFSEAGTGKTASIIWAADYLMNKGLVKRVLVLCPLSIMKAAWQADLFKFAMHRSCSVAHGSADQRRKIIAAGSEFVVINFDGVAVVEEEIRNGGFDLIVVDEATAYKNAQTTRWKILNRIVRDTQPRLWMLTGTPAAQSPLDAYGLAKLVNPDGCPKYYGSFRDSVMYKVTQFKWAVKPQAEGIVHRILQPAIRFEKAQCLDLPKVTHTDRDAPLTPQQTKYYKLLKSQMVMEADGEQVSAVNAATNLNKLLQISGGAVYSDTGEVVQFDVSNRINTVLEVINETTRKVLVFVPFTHTIELLREALEKEKISCEVINGKVNLNKRSQIVADFQSKPEPRVLLIQPQAASHGLTLTEADTIIWYAPVTSVETYLQANARIDRPGQKHPMTIVHIKGSDVEAKLYQMLRGNIENHQKIIDLYRQEVLQSG
jgi:SNF2 family DNA or RNA helicase